MWLKVSAQRHTHTESPPTFFIPLKTRSFIIFFYSHVQTLVLWYFTCFKNSHTLFMRVSKCFVKGFTVKCVIQGSWKYVFSFCVLFGLHRYMSLALHEVLHLYASSNLGSSTCVITAVRVCFNFWNMCVTFDATLYIWHHLHIIRLHINMSLRYLFRVNINIQLSIYILFVNLNLILLY